MIGDPSVIMVEEPKFNRLTESMDLTLNPWALKLKHNTPGRILVISCTYFLWVFLLFTPYMERSLYWVVKV